MLGSIDSTEILGSITRIQCLVRWIRLTEILEKEWSGTGPNDTVRKGPVLRMTHQNPKFHGRASHHGGM